MAKGSIGTSMGGSIEYRYSLKTTTRNCRNCANYSKGKEDFWGERQSGFCRKFGIEITDTSNATVCKTYKNRHVNKKRSTTGKRKNKKNPRR